MAVLQLSLVARHSLGRWHAHTHTLSYSIYVVKRVAYERQVRAGGYVIVVAAVETNFYCFSTIFLSRYFAYIPLFDSFSAQYVRSLFVVVAFFRFDSLRNTITDSSHYIQCISDYLFCLTFIAIVSIVLLLLLPVLLIVTFVLRIQRARDLCRT